ncbi:MAG TPA: PA domain-containing protein, partial [Blastocatellia bacterium]|nr:PA domain-containing protein [Blastocatellia bacterium]
GEVVYVGKGCKPKHYPTSVQGRIALIDSSGCNSKKKLKRSRAAGAVAAVIMTTSNFVFTPAEGGATMDIPAVMISGQEGERIRAAIAGGLNVQVSVTGDPLLNSWGHLRIYDTTDMASPRQIGSFATAGSRMCPPPDPSGWYTVHNPFVIGDRAYLSWYADGLRVLDISDPSAPREIAFFVPGDHQEASSQTIAPHHNEPVNGEAAAVWGVFVKGELIFLSDIKNGLYILRHRPEQ